MPSSAIPPESDLPQEAGPPKARWYRALAKQLAQNSELPLTLLETLAEECLEKGASLPALLTTRRLLPEAKIYGAWASLMGVAYIDLDPSQIDSETLRSLPSAMCSELRVIPVRKTGDEITVAMVDPNDVAAVDRIRRHIDSPILVVMTSPNRFKEALNFCQFEETDEESGLDLGLLNIQELSSPEDLEKIAGDDAIIRLVNKVFSDAVKSGASDIHIEPREEKLRIRFRVDGILAEFYNFPRALHAPFVSRVKILANLDIAEKRKPLDGAIKWEISSTRTVEFRVSTLPTVHGEKIVLRILDQSQFQRGLSDLSFMHDQQQLIKAVISKSHGIFFTTGPTGSGKTTTLYAILQALNGATLNITTIEDPVEFKLPLINQIAVDAQAGRSFASVLRAVLRQDPDVVLVGEIRDQETATIAVQAALTGHLVLSTLHSNTAIQAIPRLLNIGVERHLLAPSLVGLHAQRLVRRLCPDCQVPDSPDAKNLEYVLGIKNADQLETFRGEGCDACRGSGYRGRLALHEVLLIDEDIRQLIYEGAGTQSIQRAAARAGFRTLVHDGLRKCLSGLTSLSEVLRVASSD